MRSLPALALFLGLAACTLSLPGRGGDAAPAPLSPDAVSVTPLAPTPTTATGAAQGQPAAPGTDPGLSPLQPAPIPPAPPTAPAEPASPDQIACLAKGGIWSSTGLSDLKTCITRTRDAGKSCRKQGDCEGLCLARSRSCAPVTPLFGCNPILQADGTEATLCID